MKILILTFLLVHTLYGSTQVEFDICIPTAWTGGGSGELTLTNTGTTGLAPGSTFEIDWPGVTSISPWTGFTVTGTSPFTLTITSGIPAGGSLGPLGFSLTNSGPYFLPGTGTINGNQVALLADPPCYVPPSYANFNCQDTFQGLCFIPTSAAGNSGEIQLGEGTVRSWNATKDVYVPNNKKDWAIGMAVAHTLFTNLLGVDVMSINEYFATALQETNCGCDATIINPNWVTNGYPDHETNNPVYCFDYTHGVAVGFLQEEYGTGWLELNQDIPCFIPTINFDSTIVGKNFAAQMIGKVYHDYNNLMFLQYIKCFDVMGFIENCTDPYGPEKFISAVYNRGMNTGFIQDMLVTNRAAALVAPDLLTMIPGLGQQYAEQISRTTAVLDNNMANVSALGTNTYGIPWVGVHSHRGFYDAQISWTDLDDYLDKIAPMYIGVGVNINTVKAAVQPVFNGINAGSPISFRYQLGPVIDAIVLALPKFDAMPGLGEVYGNSGGNSCNFPTARMTESTTICQNDTTNLELFLTGTSPWTVTYNHNGTNVTLNNITASPFQVPIVDTGLYYVTSVVDNSGSIGKAICDSVNVSFDPGCNVILPVELISFNAIPKGDDLVALSWETASERNNDYFSIQRSVDGHIWKDILTVPGYGNSQTYLYYSDWDFDPLIGLSYYRLKQTDFDGVSTFSAPVAVQISGGFNIYPNPVREVLTIEGVNNSSIKLVDVTGKTIAYFPNVRRKTYSMDVKDFSSGIYFVQIESNDLLYMQRVIVQH